MLNLINALGAALNAGLAAYFIAQDAPLFAAIHVGAAIFCALVFLAIETSR